MNKIKRIFSIKNWVSWTTNENKELKILNISPLSIARFFYENGAKNIALIQRLIYLSFLKVLEEENILLFTEDWQAWSGGPVVESVFIPMSEYFDKYGSNYKRLFIKSPYLEDAKILQHLKELYNSYQAFRKDNKDVYVFFEKVFSEPWELARSELINELDYGKIEFNDIINYVNQKKTQQWTKERSENFSYLLEWKCLLEPVDEILPYTKLFSNFPAIRNYSSIQSRIENGDSFFSFCK